MRHDLASLVCRFKNVVAVVVVVVFVVVVVVVVVVIVKAPRHSA
jgi:hypothetical protein